jgi:hypothetical protein
MLRSNRSAVCARTHIWLGPLLDDVICRTRSPISCLHCAYHLQVLCGGTIHLKHWTEAWRIRCTICGRILAQAGEGAFARELRWHWYEAIIMAADRGSRIVENAIASRRSRETRSGKTSAWLAGHGNLSIVPADLLWLFGLNNLNPNRPSNLSRLSFAQRFFLLAAVGAQRCAEAEYARHLLRVWLENRRVQRHATLRSRERRSGLSSKINVNSRLMPGQSQIKVATRHPALVQSQN